MKQTTFVIIAIVAVFFTGWFARPRTLVPEIETRVDTVIVRDTIREVRPVVKEILTTRIDTVFVQLAGDTVKVLAELPIERKVYHTSDYSAEIEGFRPELLSMEIYRQTQFIDRVQTVKVPDVRRWGIGIQAGYGATVYDGKIKAVPYVGIGVQYSIIKW